MARKTIRPTNWVIIWFSLVGEARGILYTR